MVNANVVISVSAVLVALILTIVIVMRQAGDPTENFSVTVTGSYVHTDGNTYNADMYYCTGEDCQFYGVEGSDTFPGYYALVGFADGTHTYVTEHSIGKTFQWDSAGALVACFPSTPLDTDVLASQVGAFSVSFAKDKTFNIEDQTGAKMVYTMAENGYTMNNSPGTDTPSVLGKSVPTVAACDVANNVTPTPDVAPGVVSTVDTTVDLTVTVGSRKLWGQHALDGHTASLLASFGYSGDAPPGWVHWTSCVNSNAVARFGYRNDGAMMVLSYAGTNDFWDALQDLKTWGNAQYHGGFYDYVVMTKGCVDNYVDMLNNWGIPTDYVVGHSLGGAAAVIYKQISPRTGMNDASVVTFGAPKTSRSTSCWSGGTRVFNANDPVASNGLGILGGFNHDVTNARTTYTSSYCNGSFWGICYSWGTSKGTQGTPCPTEAGGCSWFFDCLYNVGNHNLGEYQSFGLSSFGV